MAMPVKTPKRTVIGLVCLLFLLACVLPCIDCGPEATSSDPGWPDFTAGWHFGLLILLFGWSGGNQGVPWSANVFLVVGLIYLCFRRYRTAGVLGVVATGLGLTTWSLNWFSRPHHYHVMVGYYCWQASQLVLAVGAFWSGHAALPEPRPSTETGAAANQSLQQTAGA